jgi:transglutaminase-like putative cysteine protease
VVQVLAAALVVLYLAIARPRVEPPGGRRRGWSRVAALAAFVTLASAAAMGLVVVLPWAQPHVEDAAARLLNASLPLAQAGFSANSRLGDIERLSLSRTVVLRVWTPFPRKLRGRVLTEFDGRTWHAPQPRWRDLPSIAPESFPPDLGRWLGALPGTSFGDDAAAGRPEAVRTRMAQKLVVADTLFAPAGLAVARVSGPRLRVDRFGVVEAPADPVGNYALVHAPVAASAGDDGGPETLAVPADLDPRMATLAAALAAGAPPPATRVARTLDYLASECRYSLDVGAFTSAQPVVEFVFDKKRGYCEYFASAAALLLRLQGVPARYVTGFSMDAAELSGGHYVVRESDAHAWIETWIPGRGWVEADPTPASDYAAVHARRGSRAERATEWLRARWAEAVLAVRTGELRRLLDALSGPLAALAFLGLVLVGWRFRRPRARPRAVSRERWDGDAELREVMDRLETLWTRHGCARPAHRPPLEHLRELPRGRLPTALAAASEDVVACYYAARYGGLTPPREAVHGLARRLEETAW